LFNSELNPDGEGVQFLKKAERITIKSLLSEATSLIGDGLSELFSLGFLGSIIIDETLDTGTGIVVDWYIDDNGEENILIGQVQDNEEFTLPSGTHNILYSFGEDIPKAIVQNIPVVSQETTTVDFLPHFGTYIGEFNGVAAYSNGNPEYYSELQNYVNEVYTGIQWQCVEYARRYYLTISGKNIYIGYSNASEFYDRASEMGLDSYPNGGTTSPQVGDILVSKGGSFGHVAIARTVSDTEVCTIQQNWSNDPTDANKCIGMTVSNGNYTVNDFVSNYSIQGWLRMPVSTPDTTALSTPTGFTSTAVSSNQINLSWDASTDDIGVTGYNVYRDGVFLKSVTGTSTSDTGLNPDIEYCYTVSAYDAAGNESGQSSEACATTQTPTDVSEIIRVSVASDGTQGNNHSVSSSISGDGRYVAFYSSASNLIAGDTNGFNDIFVHDTQTGETTRVSVASDGTQGNSGSFFHSISADGRHVAFRSYASNLVVGDTNGWWDVFVHDTQAGATTRVSIASDGTQANYGSSTSAPLISADGRYVAFRSYASNLVAGDTNGTCDIFVHDTQTSATTRVSVTSDGTQGNNANSLPSISGDGRYVAFYSSASNLVADDTNEYGDIFLHDTQTGATTRVSVASDGTQGNNHSVSSSISADGRYVAFSSSASNLVAGDNAYSDIFVHDTQTGTTTRVSVASDGTTQSNSDSYYPSISADGRYVTFFSDASTLVAGDTNGYTDSFVHDTQTGVTTRVSVASDGTQGNGISYYPSISADGRYVTFFSRASTLVAGDTNGYDDTFRAPNPLYTSP